MADTDCTNCGETFFKPANWEFGPVTCPWCDSEQEGE